MNKLRYAHIPIFLLISLSARAATLAWDIPKNERLEMVRTARAQFLVNDRTRKSYEERNIIDLTCYDKKDGLNGVRGTFSVYERDSGSDVFNLREQYRSIFTIDRRGRFTVPREYFMPNLRHLPTFPDSDIEAGYAWSADADLLLNSFSVPFKITFPVAYKLVQIRKKDGGDIAVISYNFFINMTLPEGKYPPDLPLKIEGAEEGTIYWNTRLNRPDGMDEKYRIVFYFPAGPREVGSNEFRMRIETTVKSYPPVTADEKERAKRDLRKDIPADSGIDVDADKRGLVLRLGDLLFDFDSAKLRDDSREKLDTIIGVLRKKYADREIIVEGHTDSTGTPDYNRRLSNDRAESVAKYLKNRAGTDKLSYRGLGAERPLEDNATKEGRRKNRRVEIIIKLH